MAITPTVPPIATLTPAKGRTKRLLSRYQQPWRALTYIVVICVSIASIFPLYWMFVTSLLTDHDAYASTPVLFPDCQWANYARAWAMAPWIQYFLNSILISGCTVVLAVITSLFAGYAFGMMKFPGRQALFLAILALIMIPSEATLFQAISSSRRWGGSIAIRRRSFRSELAFPVSSCCVNSFSRFPILCGRRLRLTDVHACAFCGRLLHL